MQIVTSVSRALTVTFPPLGPVIGAMLTEFRKGWSGAHPRGLTRHLGLSRWVRAAPFPVAYTMPFLLPSLFQT